MSDLLTATKTVIGEARGESYEGMLAVAYVIRNRAQNKRWWGGPSWESVCLAPWQFSCWNSEKYGGQPFLRDLTAGDILGNSTYRKCLRAVLYVHDVDLPDITEGSTHYVVYSWLLNPKLRPAWADELTPTVKIGDHTFFTALR